MNTQLEAANKLLSEINFLIEAGKKQSLYGQHETIATISNLIKKKGRSILCHTATDNAVSLQKTLVQLRLSLESYKFEEANALAFKVMGLTLGLHSGGQQLDWASLPGDTLKKILINVPEKSAYDEEAEEEQFNLTSELQDSAYVSTKFKEFALPAKIEWANCNHISIKTFGCSTFEEALAYLSQHPELTVANLAEIPHVTQAQLNDLFEQCPQIKSLTIRSYIERIPEKAAQLEFLDCSECQFIIQLPESFPNLKQFLCTNCKFQQFPEAPQLRLLVCDGCKFKKFPKLPELLFLNCSGSKIENLSSELLPKLASLNCLDIAIKKLPPFPELAELLCSNLDTLPDLPKLKSLICYECSFEELNLPELMSLECYDCNKLKDISKLTKLMRIFYNNCPKLILLTSKDVSIKQVSPDEE